MAKAVKYLEGLTIHKVPYNIANTSDFKTNVMGKAADNELFIITDTPTFSLKIGNVTYDGTSNVSAIAATQSVSGLMSAADKKKLDGIAKGATKITVDTALSSTSTNPVQNKVIYSALSGKAGTSVATTNTNGLMSSADKTKLNGIATGANKTIVDTTLSDSSTNPVQNKVIKTELDKKADKTALDAKADKTALDGKLDKTGGTLTGNLTGKYFTGTWLQTTAATDLGYTPGKVAVLDQSGWVYYRTPAEIKSDIGADAVVTTSSDGLMSVADKKKLDSIDIGANKITVDTSLSSTSTNPVQNKVVNSAISNLNTLVGNTSVSTQITNAVANKVDKVSGKGLSANDYTTTEKNKLAGISENAEVNQNAFSNVVVGSTTISADSKTDTLTLVAGNNVTLTPDSTNDKITIAAKDTTYKAATTSSDGLMSASDKSKLDGIAKDATKTIIDTSLSGTSTNPVQNKVVKAELDKKFNKTGGIINGSVQVNSDSNESVAIYAGRVDADDWVKATSGVTIGRGSSAGAFVSLRCDRSSDTTESLKIFRDLYAENGDLAHVTIADPIDSDHATTKKYVDTGLSGKFDKSGGTITGTVKVNGSTYCNSIFLGGYLLNTKSKGLTFEQTDNPAGVEEILAPIRIGTPKNGDEATTKKYVDNADKKILKRAKSYVDSAITVAINSSY